MKNSLFAFAALFVMVFLTPAAHADSRSRIEIAIDVTDVNGTPVSCEGETVFALPVSKKSSKVALNYYGSQEAGYASIYATPELILRRQGIRHLGPTSPRGTRLFTKKFKGQKRGKCLENNVAVFEKLKPGKYYLIIPVFYKDTTIPERLQPINIYGAESVDVLVKISSNYRGGTFMIQVDLMADEILKGDLQSQLSDESMY